MVIFIIFIKAIHRKSADIIFHRSTVKTVLHSVSTIFVARDKKFKLYHKRNIE